MPACGLYIAGHPKAFRDCKQSMASEPSERLVGAQARQSRTGYANTATRLRADVAVVRVDVDRYKRRMAPLMPTLTGAAPKVNEYYVLIGAELNPVKEAHTTVRTPPIMCGPFPPKHRRFFESTSSKPVPPGFGCVSTNSVLGPPYRVAIACTCPDWAHRSGLAVPPAAAPDDGAKAARKVRAETLEHAAVGCKHMMACNAELLRTEPVTFGTSAAASADRDAFLNADGPAQLCHDATYAVHKMIA